MKISNFLLTILIIIVSCSDREDILPEEPKNDEPIEAPKYTERPQPIIRTPGKPLNFLVLNGNKIDREFDEVSSGNSISTINLFDNTIQDIKVDYWPAHRRIEYRNAAIDGDDVYFLLNIGNDIIKASLRDGHVIASIGVSEVFWVRHKKSIVHYRNEVITAFTKHSDAHQRGLTYLAIYDDFRLVLKKEVEIGEGYDIEQMKIIDNRLFLLLSSYEKIVLQSYNLNSKELITEKELGYGFFELQAAKSNELFLYSGQFLYTLNSSTLEEIEKIELKGSIPYMGDNPTFHYDGESDNIYYFRIAPQPSFTPFYLMVYNIKTEHSDYLNPQELIVSDAIYFDNAHKEILLTSGNKISRVSLDGEILQSFDHQYRFMNIYAY